MKIIDLLNKIANGEEVPIKIKYDNLVYEYNEQYDYKNELQINYYSVDNGTDFFNNVFCYSLNDEVEIIEEKPTQEEIKEYTNKFLKAWIPVKKQYNKLFDEIARIGNVLDLEDELEEEKKIPEKIEYYDDSIAWVIDDVGQLSDVDKVIIDKLNEVLDYLKSKGDE